MGVFRVEGMELLMIASGPLVGGIIGMIVDRYPAPFLKTMHEDRGTAARSAEPSSRNRNRLHAPGPWRPWRCRRRCRSSRPPSAGFCSTLALIDLRHLEVPDALSLPLIPAGLAATWWIEPQAILVHAAAAAAGAGAIWLLGEAFRRLRGRAGIGGGDVRLFAVAGAWVGLAALPGVLFLSGIFGLIAAAFLVHRGWVAWGDRIPFVPALSAALWVVFLVPATGAAMMSLADISAPSALPTAG